MVTALQNSQMASHKDNVSAHLFLFQPQLPDTPYILKWGLEDVHGIQKDPCAGMVQQEAVSWASKKLEPPRVRALCHGECTLWVAKPQFDPTSTLVISCVS